MRRFLIFITLTFTCCYQSYGQVFTDSNLPIVVISTDRNLTIPDAPRVLATMKIIYRGQGKRNYLTDIDSIQYLNYNGRISIETRGSSSQTLPKKQYGLTTLKDDSVNNNVSLLGLPEENDWILNGLGFDPSLIRDYVNYNLSRMIGQYASRTVYCEVVLNGYYNGLYMLDEKIKAGNDRVDVIKIDKTDNSYPIITGGYITKADKVNEKDPMAWTMPSYLGTVYDVTYIHVLPQPDKVTKAQNNYIHSEFERLAAAAFTGNTSFMDGFPSVIDIPSFIDFMIISELGANADSYQYSTFFHKDRNGKIQAGPIWDNNLTFGYDLAIWGFDRSKTDTWQFFNKDNEGSMFWRDLFNNSEFKCYLSKRWNELTRPGHPLNISSIDSLIDNAVATISEAVPREQQKWGTVPDLAGEVIRIKDFVKKRIDWITLNIGPYSGCSNVATPPLVIAGIMYNPDSTLVFPKSKDQEFIEILNNGNSVVDLTGVYFRGSSFVYQFPPFTMLFPNSSKILASNMEVFRAKYGISASGMFTRNLSNKGESLILADGFGNIIDSVTYSNTAPWPNADGNGLYLELKDPSLDNSLAQNWKASYPDIVSVENVESKVDLRLYPLPVRESLTIESSDIILRLQLYNYQGNMLQEAAINSELYNLDMSEYPAGIYLLEIFTAQGNVVRKIVKM